jgi:hypothetical protein
MASRLYLRSLTNNQSGTYPTGEQSASTPNFSGASATTMMRMNPTKGTTMVGNNGTTLANITPQLGFMRYFTSPPLNGAQTISGTITLNVAVGESAAQANLINITPHVYLWRPSTGAYITLMYNTQQTKTEPTAPNTTVWHIPGLAITTANGLNGDVIICEIWFGMTQANATARTVTLSYDGSVENTTDMAVVSNHASYLEFSANLNFTGFATYNKKGNFFRFFN